MNNVKNTFSIKDLENLTGIKAHTIRIWEKRYKVLAPMRTDSNIRLYGVDSLQKLLNISLLNNFGYKISKISKLPDERIPALVNDIISEKSISNHAISAFKMSMMNFDQGLFFSTYAALLAEKPFREVFREVFLPLLDEVGILWQTGTITPAHEHFISYLIKQKLLVNTEQIQATVPTKTDRTFVLYLPLNEIHELGLMYVNYELIAAGYKTIYLGESLPVSCLIDVKRYFDKITFVCYATVEPNRGSVNDYIAEVIAQVGDGGSDFWLMGKMAQFANDKIQPGNVALFNSIPEFIAKIAEP